MHSENTENTENTINQKNQTQNETDRRRNIHEYIGKYQYIGHTQINDYHQYSPN